MAAAGEYWNHNTAYHPWLLGLAERRRGRVLDVGCGDGLLVQRLAEVADSVTGIDPDPMAVRRARERVGPDASITLLHCRFDEFDPGDSGFDLITFVASLHHMDLRGSLVRARELLNPGGSIAVVGLSANASAADWLFSALCLPAVRIGSRWHREQSDVGVAVADPRESLAEIRRVAGDVLPGAQIRRALYYRYLLFWTRDTGPVTSRRTGWRPSRRA